MNYPDLLLAPRKVQMKAQTFGIHDFCAATPDESCARCPHLIKMAYDCFYGHITDPEALQRAIRNDIRSEARKG